jgi:hypothetical protein
MESTSRQAMAMRRRDAISSVSKNSRPAMAAKMYVRILKFFCCSALTVVREFETEDPEEEAKFTPSGRREERVRRRRMVRQRRD